MSTKFNEYKELLNNLFKETFDNKLKALEKKSKNQILIISSTKELTKNITSLSINMRNQILKKNKKENSVNKNKKKSGLKNAHSPKSSFVKIPSRLKTPLKPAKKKYGSRILKTAGNSKQKDSKIKNKNKLINGSNNELNKTFEKSRTFKNLNRNNKNSKNSLNIDNEKKNKTLYSFYTKNNNNNYNKDNYRKRHSITSFKLKLKLKDKNLDNNNKTNVRNINQNCNLFNKVLKNMGNRTERNSFHKKLNKTFERRGSKHIKNENSSSSSQNQQKNKKSNNNENNNNSQNLQEYNNKINGTKKQNIKLTFMELNLQKDNSFFKDDSLLVTPLEDCDFLDHDLLFKKNELKEIIKKNNLIDYFCYKDETKITIIFEFLSKNDLMQLKSVSKYFNKNVLNYYLKCLNDKKNNLEKMKNEFINKLGPKDFKYFYFSKGTLRANELLNESIMSKFFQEEQPPRNDILFIYEVFFQLINNPIIQLKNNKKEFWKNCRLYFLNEGQGKTGNLLKNIIINNKIDISEDNLYKLYELVKNKLHIILPSYFSKISNITALITFSLKDILNFLGFSIDKEDIKHNGYWTYCQIIDSISKKINMIIKYQK